MIKPIDETLVETYKDTSFDDLVDNYLAEEDCILLNACPSDAHREASRDLYEIGKALFGDRWVNDPEVLEVRNCKS